MRRTIIVSTPGTRLYQKHKLLHVEREQEILDTIPFEDIEVVILDSQGISVSTGVLASLAAKGSIVVVTGLSHHPEGLYFPVSANTLSSKRLRAQISASDALKNNLWKRIVQGKILCQAAQVVGTSAYTNMKRLAAKVSSGDKNNLEAQAARMYWTTFFGRKFLRRRDGTCPNNFLNYGYAVLRAAVARSICAAGLNPSLGIQHSNQYNTFCLADDLMEPYRPWVDGAAKKLIKDGQSELNPDTKSQLVNVLYEEVRLRDQVTSLLPAIQATASSLAACLDDAVSGNGSLVASRKLLLPEPVKGRS